VAPAPLPPLPLADEAPVDATLFDFTAADLQGTPRALAEWRGQVALVVNVASRCGFTPQYVGLEALWTRYRAGGLVVLGFPCDQFGHQEPGDASEIERFCTLEYGVDFPMFAKVEVNGPGADPLWRWLKGEKPGLLGSEAIKWNFTKFLVGRDGRVRSRHAPTDTPESLAPRIEPLLAEPVA
jgi:glutathione peroxidase